MSEASRWYRHGDVFNHNVPRGYMEELLKRAESIPWDNFTPEERTILIRRQSLIAGQYPERANYPGDEERWLDMADRLSLAPTAWKWRGHERLNSAIRDFEL